MRARSDYREAKKNLRQAITSSQRASWKDLLWSINKDPWGRPYRTVLKKLKGPDALDPLVSFPMETVRKIVITLFPQDGNQRRDGEVLEDPAPNPEGFEKVEAWEVEREKRRKVGDGSRERGREGEID